MNCFLVTDRRTMKGQGEWSFLLRTRVVFFVASDQDEHDIIVIVMVIV